MKRKIIRSVILGISASGKSSFISGIHESMIKSCYCGHDGSTISLSLLDPNGNVGPLSAFCSNSNLKNYTAGKIMGNIAGGTKQTKFFEFRCDVMKGNENQNIDLRLFDYRGGVISSVDNEEQLKEAQVIAEEILESEVIFITLDSNLLYNYRVNDDVRDYVGAAEVNNIFTSMASQMDHPATVIVLLTKVDSSTISAEYKANDYEKLKELGRSALSSIFARQQYYTAKGWSFDIIPVTLVGEGCSVSSLSASGKQWFNTLKDNSNHKQKNMDAALVTGIRNVCRARRNACEQTMNLYNQEIQQLSHGGLFDISARKKRKDYLIKEIGNLQTDYYFYNSLSEKLG